MPKLVNSPPAYRKHRPSGQAVVTLNGRDFYLGPHGTKTSRNEYDRLIGEWLQSGRTLAFADRQAGDLSIVELAAAFWLHAKSYYVGPPGKPTREVHNYQRVLKPLKELYGRLAVAEFGPIKFKVVRDKLVESGLSRQTVNGHMIRLRNIFRWGVAHEMVPASVLDALRAVDGLRSGKTTARDTEPVKPVSDATVQQTLPHLPLVVSDMVRLQRLTGARPDEICMLRPCDLDRNSDVWTYRPMHHKNEHHGKDRLIFIGPKGQDILRPYLLRQLSAGDSKGAS
jgi:integrase